MNSNDLVPYYGGDNSNKLGIRQGVILSWDSTDGSNSVSVGGTILTDLTIMNPSEAAYFQAGDVVNILTLPGTWGILGRFVVPGSAQAIAALSAFKTQSATVSDTDSVTSSSYAAAPTNPGPEITITVGPSGRLLVFITAEISGQSTKAANNTAMPMGRMGITLSGANTVSAVDIESLMTSNNLLVNASITLGVSMAATRVVLIEDLNPGATTITAQYRMQGNGTSINFNNRNLTAMAI